MLSSKVTQAAFPLAATWALLRRLLYGTFVLVLIVLAAALGSAGLPRAFGYSTLVVNGGSMGDAVPVGSLVIARWTAAEEVEVGDVIVIREERNDGSARSKIHRVVSLDNENGDIFVETKGDVNPAADPKLYVLPDRVLTPAQTVPYLGYLVGFAMTPLGWALLVALPATLIALFALRAIWADDDTLEAEVGATK